MTGIPDNSPKTCPLCRLTNPGSAERCDCGYRFTLQRTDAGIGPDERICPSCEKAIKKEALKCPFCRRVVDSRLGGTLVPEDVVNEINKSAGHALTYGILGFFICAPVFGSMAIANGNAALELLSRYPGYEGPRGKARTGMVLGWIDWGLLVIAAITRMSGTV